jgi:hypothetical protein
LIHRPAQPGLFHVSLIPMQYILRIGPWHIGPFPTHIGAQHFAESHGMDDFAMIVLDDPAEAPGRIAKMVRERGEWRPLTR